MNKKVSTLLTVAMMLGSSLLSSSAFAAEVSPAQFKKAIETTWVFDVNNLDEEVKEAVLADGGLIELTGDLELNKLSNGSHPANFVVLKNKGITLTSKGGQKYTFNANILVAAEGVTISNLKFAGNSENVNAGGWHSSYITAFADDLKIINNVFEGNKNNINNNDAIILIPQTNKVAYEITGNTFSGFKSEESVLNSAIKVELNSKHQWLRDDPSVISEDLKPVLAEIKGWVDQNFDGEFSGYPKNINDEYVDAIMENNTFGEGNTAKMLVAVGGSISGTEDNQGTFTSARFSDIENGTKDFKYVLEHAGENLQIKYDIASVEELQTAMKQAEIEGKKLVATSESEQKNIVNADGTPDNVYPCETVDGAKYLSSAQLNNINRGSFSLGYEFAPNQKATDNPFNRELKAFYLNDEYVNRKYVFLATSWPASADNKNVLSKEEFNKCEFLVAKATEDVNQYWNILGHSEFGESVYFEVVKGDRLLSNCYEEDLKSKKFAYNNAQFAVTKDDNGYVFTMSGLVGLDKDGNRETSSSVTIALVSNGKQRIVTTVLSEGVKDIDGKLCIHASIGNTRTVDAEHFLSTDKASVFNIKFISKKIKNDETKSEYNKYLTINQNGLLAHGSDFTNLNAPESQWIVKAHNDDNTFTFQNRENEYMSFDAELLSTDKDNVFELRSEDVLQYAYVDKADGEYTVVSGDDKLNGMTVELTAVTPNKEAGYATTELDNAGLVRFVFNRIDDDNVKLSDFYVTANDENDVEVNKEESEAAQFSIVKFAAPSTATALADSIYADNDYVVWNTSKKEVETVEDGDSIAVVAYAFKQLRADGKNYYLDIYYNYSDNSTVAKVVKEDDEAQAPRFLVKLYKNGSYGLVPVYNHDWNRGDYFRNIVYTGANTLSLNNDAKIELGTSVYYDYTTAHKFDFNILKETPGTSFNHVPQHVTMESVNGGYIAMNAENNNGIIAPVPTLKADYTKEDLTFWLDTTDSEAVTPSFMISKAGNYMYNATDSLNRYNGGTASEEKVKEFALNVNGKDQARVIFQSADLTKVEDIENYKFQIVQSPESEEEYIIKSLNGYNYVAAHNQQLYIATNVDAALRLTVTPAEAPTSNEGVSATEVKVIANNGSINVRNAAGKNVVVSTILGQVVANEVLTSDNATINVPAGIVVVAVEGESFKVNVK